MGGAIGDAMGMPVETLSRHSIIKRFGEVTTLLPRISRTRIKPAGSWTDDTHLCMLTAKSLLENKNINIEHLTRTYIEALDHPFGITCTTREALELRALGKDPALEIKGPRHSGCGAAVRMPPVALTYHQDMDVLLEHAIAVSKITHHDNDAVGGAVATAFTIAWALRDEVKIPDFLSNLKNIMASLKSNLQFSFGLDGLVNNMFNDPKETIDGIVDIGDDGASIRLIPSAIYAFMKNPGNFEKMILDCVNAGGDADSRAAIAGYISGAFNGMDAIPTYWTRKIENKNMILDYADRLYELMINSQAPENI